MSIILILIFEGSGFKVIFGQDLKPSIDGWSTTIKNGVWVLKGNF